MNVDLPYIVEYAKSGRASCKTCKKGIEKDVLRIGIMVQSPKFDGKMPMWHHAKCFLEKKKAVTAKVEEIANFDNIKWDDQKMIKDGLGKAIGKGSAGKGKKEEKSDFSVEYAKSSRSSCKLCGDKINKGEIRISKLITNTPEAHRYGPMPGWHHVDCFVKIRLELGFTDSADMLPGFKSLSEEDRPMVLEKLEKLGVKKRKAETTNDATAKKLAKEEEKNLKIMKAQNDLLFNMRDLIKKNLSKKEMITLLEYNNQHVSIGEQNIRDNLSDFLVFGAIKACPECKNSRPRFKLDTYRCSGNLTEWTKCMYVTKCPEREPFRIPEDMKEEYDFLREYKYVKRDRLFPEKPESTSASATKGPLDGCLFMLLGKFQINKSAMEHRVTELGGLISSKVTSSLTCCISTEDEVAKSGKNVLKACNFDVHIVSPKFLEDVKSGSSIAIAIKENVICEWGGDPILKFGIKQENKLKIEAKSKSMFTNPNKSSTLKVSVKGGAAVDPESGLESKCHVYRRKDTIYNCVLGVVDVARDRNTFYKLQILEYNNRSRYHVFRAWGRVGTTIGGTKLDDFNDVSDAIALYESLYLERTGNEWKNRKNFVKKPGALYPLDIDYGEEFEDVKELRPGDNSKLAKPIQELICLIFDIEAMKKAMVEFEIDLKKMPLGKLSKKQIEKAYSVLSEAQDILVTGSNATKILDATNRFYTLIPHDFGLKQPTLLDNEELIKSKIEMLDSLLEIEFAYKMLKGDGQTSEKDPVDEHYEKLNTDIEVLEKSSEEFDVIKTYLKNTHGATHYQYDLALQNVFKINRHGENERYQKFKNLHNKKLLWHGSRLTNYIGILSQGLRIAPPEAPPTGYMFGKGIYFADMVSKSANYCYPSQQNPRGLLLLCEVALGDMLEKEYSQYIEKLPSGKNSVKGCGKNIPNPKQKTFLGDVEVPYGKPVQSDITYRVLQYNEYIVYDVNQVNVKYLLDVKFKYK